MKTARRSGFSLVELVVVSGISTMVLTAILSVFIGSNRFIRGTIMEADLAMRARDLRERLLFQTVPPNVAKGNRTFYGGLLSSLPHGYGADVVKLERQGGTWVANVPGADTSGATPCFSVRQVELTLHPDKGLQDASASPDSGWLRPANHPFGWEQAELSDNDHAGTGFIDFEQYDWSRDAQGNKNANYRMTIRYSADEFTRVERIHIPVFGRQQRPFPGETFHDYSQP